MRLVDLFSGIGGFSLAASWVWGDELEIECFVEIDPFCQQILRKHWPGVPIYDDIQKIQWVLADTQKFGFNNGIQFRGNGEKKEGKQYVRDSVKIPGIDLLTGGFPCQPFSCAGKRAGTEDDRYLWPEMLRAIAEIRPTWVIAENVAGIGSLFQYSDLSEVEDKEYSSEEEAKADFKGIREREGTNTLWLVLDDLEKLGYEVQPFIIPAASLGAPHRRDRVWIVAHAIEARTRDISREASDQRRRSSEDRGKSIRQENRETCSGRASSADRHAPDTECLGWEKRTRSRIEYAKQKSERQNSRNGYAEAWQEHWYAVATRFCRVDDGVPNRVDRLKCLGNAIVPQVAREIFKAIKEVDTWD